MKCRWLLVSGLVLLLIESRAGHVAEDFSAIARKNAFRLSQAKPEPNPELIRIKLPQVTLQGVTTLLDTRQALLKIEAKGAAVGTEVCCVLSEGQTRNGVKVLRIEVESGTVWLTNQGAEQILSLKRGQ